MQLNQQELEMASLSPGHSSNPIRVTGLPFEVALTCLQTYEDTLYLGTSHSRVYSYHLNYDPLTSTLALSQPTDFYPHCTVTYSILAHPLYLITVPLHQQQLIRIWDRPSLLIKQAYEGHRGQITQAKWLGSEQHVASVSQDGTARVWSVHSEGRSGREVARYESGYPLLVVEEVEGCLAVGGDDCSITMWDWRSNNVRCRMYAHPGSVLWMGKVGRRLMSAGGDGVVKGWAVTKRDKEKRQLDEGEVGLKEEWKRGQYQMVETVFGSRAGEEMWLMDGRGYQIRLKSGAEVSYSSHKMNYSQRVTSMVIWKQLILYCVSSHDNQLRCAPISLHSSQNNPHSTKPVVVCPPSCKQKQHCSPTDQVSRCVLKQPESGEGVSVDFEMIRSEQVG